MKFPVHEGSLTLEHNPQKACDTDMREYLADSAEYFPFESAAARATSIARNELWTLRWYPRAALGSYMIAAPTLEGLLAYAGELGRSEELTGGKKGVP